MSPAVPFQEAVEILQWIGVAPGSVRALRRFDAGTYGPLPFFVDWRGQLAEVTLTFAGGVIDGLASIRIETRFSNDHDWIGEADGGPWDELGDGAKELLEFRLQAASTGP